ncbi:MAG: terminase small subunit [Methanobrevibacter sp.]|nr:terminase small subunit [Methanobrevibacter sp.]
MTDTTTTSDIYPTRAYDLLTDSEREAVDSYVEFAVRQQRARHQRILAALNVPIPSEYIRRSRQALNRPVLRAAIAERITEIAAEADISPDRALHEYATVAFSDITDYLQPGLYGEPQLKDIHEIPPSKAGAIKSIECQPGHMGTRWKITLHDKLPALKTLTDLMGMTAPERPPVLADYAKQEIRQEQAAALSSPESEYTELLESVASKERQA